MNTDDVLSQLQPGTALPAVVIQAMAASLRLSLDSSAGTVAAAVDAKTDESKGVIDLGLITALGRYARLRLGKGQVVTAVPNGSHDNGLQLVISECRWESDELRLAWSDKVGEGPIRCREVEHDGRWGLDVAAPTLKVLSEVCPGLEDRLDNVVGWLSAWAWGVRHQYEWRDGRATADAAACMLKSPSTASIVGLIELLRVLAKSLGCSPAEADQLAEPRLPGKSLHYLGDAIMQRIRPSRFVQYNEGVLRHALTVGGITCLVKDGIAHKAVRVVPASPPAEMRFEASH